MHVGARDFDVIPEDIVEPHLERLNAGTLPFARFNLCDVLPPVQAEVAQLVQFGVKARADGAPIGQVERRLIRDRLQNQTGHVGQVIQPLVKRSQPLGLLCIEAALEGGDLFERAAKRQQVARAGRAQRDPGEQALQIQNAAELLAEFRAQDGLLQQFAQRVQPLLDFTAIHRWTQQALP